MFKQQALNLRQKIALQNAKKLHALRKQAAVEGRARHFQFFVQLRHVETSYINFNTVYIQDGLKYLTQKVQLRF